MSGRMENNSENSIEKKIESKMSNSAINWKMLVVSLLLGIVSPDFTEMQSKTNSVAPATWSCNATGMVALEMENSTSRKRKIIIARSALYVRRQVKTRCTVRPSVRKVITFCRWHMRGSHLPENSGVLKTRFSRS